MVIFLISRFLIQPRKLVVAGKFLRRGFTEEHPIRYEGIDLAVVFKRFRRKNVLRNQILVFLVFGLFFFVLGIQMW